jgi:hypothetical protein
MFVGEQEVADQNIYAARQAANTQDAQDYDAYYAYIEQMEALSLAGGSSQ